MLNKEINGPQPLNQQRSNPGKTYLVVTCKYMFLKTPIYRSKEDPFIQPHLNDSVYNSHTS